jgi:CheY-like chemotaxis protein
MIGTLLLVEDGEDDVLFMRRAFTKVGIANPLQVVGDGQEALDYLAGNGRFHDRCEYPLPSLVLLDLKLPQIPGMEVLKWIRASDRFEPLPVIVLTSSREGRDIDEAYRTGTNAYLVKPNNAEKLVEIVQSLREFWLKLNQAPCIKCEQAAA